MAQQITYQFSAQDDYGSKLIRYYEHADYSHVDIVLPDNTLLGSRHDVVAGVPPGVHIRPNNYANFSATKRVVVTCTDEQFKKGIDWALSQVGKEYDETAIIGFIVGRNWRNDDDLYCSEFGARLLEPDVSGILPYMLAAKCNKITPGDLLLILSTMVNVW